MVEAFYWDLNRKETQPNQSPAFLNPKYSLEYEKFIKML